MERFRSFERQQETRRRNFFKLREMLGEVMCVQPLAVHRGVRKHGVHMFVMRYKREHCGGLPVEDFLGACGAEGAPIYRSYKCTMAGQLAIEKLIAKRPGYFRVMPTPVAEEAITELVYIPQNVFLGTENDMSEIAAAVRKVHAHYAPRTVRARADLVEARQRGTSPV
jgi:dTDP-4-amino-4,6-dideoxygalactose transaminase